MADKQKKQLKLNFYQKTIDDGSTVTRVRLRRETFTPIKRKGVLHKVVGLQDRITGDVPSVTKALDSIEPKTVKGKIGVFTAKSAYKFSKGTIKSALVAESVVIFTTESISPNKQTQLHFTRKKTSDGKYKTKARLVNSTEFARRRQRGLLHKTAALRYRIKGDVPSPTKKLNAFEPKTFKGQVGKGLAKGTYKFLKTSSKTVLITGLLAEDIALIAKDKAVNQFRNKIRSEATDDMSLGLLKTAGKITRFVQTPVMYLKDCSDYKAEKQRLKFRKSQADLLDVGIKFKGFSRKRPLLTITKSNGKQIKLGFKRRRLFTLNISKANSERNRIKAELKERKAVFSTDKKKFKEHKNAYKSSSKSNIGKAKLERQKADFKAEKKNFKEFKKTAKKEVKFVKKARNNQRRLKKLQNPHSVPVKIGIGAISGAWNKLSTQVSADDDMGKAVKNVVNGVVSAHRNIKNTAIKVTEYNDRRLDKKISKQRAKLKQQEYKLSKNRKKNKTAKYSWKRWYKYVGYDPRQPFSENMSNIIKKALQEIVKLAGSAVKYIVAGSMPLIAFIGCLLIVIYMVTSVFTQASFVMGTYTAKDNELSKAVTEYTKIAHKFNQSIIDCGKRSNWKDGLYNLGAITNAQKNKFINNPSEFIYGRSYKFSYQSARYDFNPYILWSFLCAYYYDFESSYKATKGGETYSPDYWKLDRGGKDKIQELFEKEYVFHYFYDDRSHWAELDSYEFLPDTSNSNFWSVYNNSNFNHDQMEIRNVDSKIEKFCKNDILYFSERTLEILNANKLDSKGNMTRTGFYIQDQTRDVHDSNWNVRKAFYTYRDGQFFYFNTEPRTSFCWTSNGQEIHYVVTPDDSFNATGGSVSDGCLVSFYRKNQWLESGTLYYTVEQKQSFLETAKALLKSMSYAKERLEYFELLLGDNSKVGKLYGNHQVIQSPIPNTSIHDLTGRIYNGYGYDVQKWNEQHCSINDIHYGLDITCATYDDIVSPIDGKITKVTGNSIEIISDKIDFWYEEDKHQIKITIDNIRSSLSSGSEVKTGDIIGNPTANHRCGSLNNINGSTIYIHINTEIYSSKISDWQSVDPRIIMY